MSAGTLNLIIEQGATYQKKLIWQDNDKTPIDNTGSTGRMQIRASKEDPTILLELTTENGRMTLGGANGEINLFIAAGDTEAITWTAGVYDLELEDGAGIVTRLVEGKVAVSLEVTR